MLPMHVSDRKQHPPLSPQGGWLNDGRQVLHFQPCRYDRWSQSLEVVVWMGDGATADLLVLSQVVLSLQLGWLCAGLALRWADCSDQRFSAGQRFCRLTVGRRRLA
jgi:hypothetical protein